MFFRIITLALFLFLLNAGFVSRSNLTYAANIDNGLEGMYWDLQHDMQNLLSAVERVEASLVLISENPSIDPSFLFRANNELLAWAFTKGELLAQLYSQKHVLNKMPSSPQKTNRLNSIYRLIHEVTSDQAVYSKNKDSINRLFERIKTNMNTNLDEDIFESFWIGFRAGSEKI